MLSPGRGKAPRNAPPPAAASSLIKPEVVTFSYANGRSPRLNGVEITNCKRFTVVAKGGSTELTITVSDSEPCYTGGIYHMKDRTNVYTLAP
jgi:hypothetical protein